MSNVGATTGKEPDYIEDEDLATLDELRGDMKAINKARMSMAEKATVVGIRKEMQEVKRQLSEISEQNNRLVNLYQIVRNELDQLKQQRAIELTMRVNNGSTTPED